MKWAHRVKNKTGCWAEVGLSKEGPKLVAVAVGNSVNRYGRVRIDVDEAIELRRALSRAIRAIQNPLKVV